jgi:hypothetical protein
MARTAVARADARAREGRPGLAYKRAGGRLGSVRSCRCHLHAWGGRGHGRRRAPLRSLMARHGRCAGRRIRATWHSHLPQTAQVSARRRYAVTSGHTDASACAPEAGTARTAGGRRGRARRHARTRLGVPGAVGISLNSFQNSFSPIFRTKVHLRVCRMDLPGPTTSVGTRTDYSGGPGTTRLALHGT